MKIMVKSPQSHSSLMENHSKIKAFNIYCNFAFKDTIWLNCKCVSVKGVQKFVPHHSDHQPNLKLRKVCQSARKILDKNHVK